MNKKKILLALALLLLVTLAFASGLLERVDLGYFQGQRGALEAFTEARPALSRLLFFLLYVAVTALSLPVAAVLTLVGGALFGLGWGLLLVSFASSIGATAAFLAARTILRDWVRARYGRALERINRGVEKDGAFYLFTLRLVPLFPFVLVNLAAALTPLRTRTFYLVSQAGMLPGTFLYVNVGAQLGEATSVPEVFSAGVLLSLLAAAAFPWVAKALLESWRARRAYQGFPRPRRFDANLVVIGGGAAGLVCAYIAALLKARVILIEKQRMGGDCLNTGCVPSKALLRSAAVKALTARAPAFGIDVESVRVDFPRVMDHVRRAIAAVAPHDSRERYTSLGVECIEGEARVLSPFTVAVNGREIATRAIVVATGAAPVVPPIPGLLEAAWLTSDTVWDLGEVPGRLLVLGGGPVGCELGQAFARLGARVTLVEQAPRLLPREDEEVSRLLAQTFEAEGIAVLTGARVTRVATAGAESTAWVEIAGKRNDGEAEAGGVHPPGRKAERTVEIAFDRVLVAFGRKPSVQGFGLEELGVLAEDGGLELDAFLRTRFPNILACGDAAGPYRFTHMAAFQAWYASINGLFGRFRKFRPDYSAVPWAIFTEPEVARVGLSEEEARARGTAAETVRFGMEGLDRALVDGQARGFVKVLTAPGKDRILGAVIAGPHAGELIQPFVLAMTHGLGLKKLMSAIHIYPTYMEANRYAAGEWRRRHAPAWLFPWLERFHGWLRGS